MNKLEDLLDEFAEEISSPSGGEFDLDPAQVLENYQLARKYAAQAIEVEVAKAREQGFQWTRAAFSFNRDCKNCHANELTLGYLIKPETAEVESNG